MPLGQPGSPRSTRPPGADQAADVAVRTTLEVLFYESTVLWAGATALLGDEGRLTYSDLMVRAQNVAAVLRHKGMRHGDLVGIVGLRTFGSIAGILGILLAGGVYVPFDVQGQSSEKLARQVDESAIRLLVTDCSDEAGDRLPWARRLMIIDASSLEQEFMPLFGEVKLPHRLPEDPAAVVFNAVGHGVLVTHAGIVRLATSGAVMEFRSSDTVLLHAGAQEHTFQMELWGALLAGGTVALAPQGWPTSAMPAHEYARVMRRFRVSAICARPTLLEELAREPLAPLDQVKQAVVDATELAPALLTRLSGGDRAVRVRGGIGAAETTSFAVSVQMNVEQTGHATSIPGSDAMVLMPDGHEAATGTLGVLAITGDALAIGYLGQPEATLAAFTEAQRDNNQRLRCFRLPVKAARLADGSLLTGEAAVSAAAAVKATQKRMGTAEEIEALLLEHPLVRECVALSFAPGERVTCVFATLKQGEDPRAERALREHLESQLPHEAQPSALILVPRIPLNAEGKPDRARLSEQCEAVLRRYTPGQLPEVLPEKQTDVVRSIWQRLLHRMQVDPDEDFYAGGGTSVQRIRLYAELNQRFPGAFTMTELRSLNTIRKVIQHLNSDVARDRMLASEHRGA
jgi:acyl-coenzyme A synthetase/AMP-(fatty) acid ligase/acyl carrier protein